MPTEKTSQMGANIGKRVRNYVVLFALITIFTIWGKDLRDLLLDGFSRWPDKTAKLIASAVTAALAVAGTLLGLGRDIDLHNALDRAFFHVRRKVDEIIQKELIEAARQVGAPGWQKMAGDRPGVMHLFYHFANAQSELRSLAFTYWEQYFVNLYVICFSAVGFLVSVVVLLARRTFDFAALGSALFLTIMVPVAIATFRGLVPKICELPRKQVLEIRASNTEALRAQVEARFATTGRDEPTK